MQVYRSQHETSSLDDKENKTVHTYYIAEMASELKKLFCQNRQIVMNYLHLIQKHNLIFHAC